jgi:hypothetical protein
MAQLILFRGGAQGKTTDEVLQAARQRLGREAFIVYLDAIARNRSKIVDCATGLPPPRFRKAVVR